jgi:hypothetical protein
LTADAEDIPVRGNAVVSGDDAADKEIEDGIIARLESGDEWAWCYAALEATCGDYRAHDGLGCCCYTDEPISCRPGATSTTWCVPSSEKSAPPASPHWRSKQGGHLVNWAINLASWNLDDENRNFLDYCPGTRAQFSLAEWRVLETELLNALLTAGY